MRKEYHFHSVLTLTHITTHITTHFRQRCSPITPNPHTKLRTPRCRVDHDTRENTRQCRIALHIAASPHTRHPGRKTSVSTPFTTQMLHFQKIHSSYFTKSVITIATGCLKHRCLEITSDSSRTDWVTLAELATTWNWHKNNLILFTTSMLIKNTYRFLTSDSDHTMAQIMAGSKSSTHLEAVVLTL